MIDSMPPATPLVPVVARLYSQNGYRRASTKSGPGTQLVQLMDAEAAIGVWRQRAELRQVALEAMKRDRDLLLGAVRVAVAALSEVEPKRSYADAISVCVQLQQTLKSLK